MSPAFKLWCLAVSVVLVAQCGVECVKRNKSLGPPVENDEECIVSKLIPKVVTNKIVNPLSTASIGLANKALAQVDKYVDYAVKKYHGKQPPKRVLSKNRSSKGKPSVFNPHPTDIIRKILNVGDGDNDNGFTNINGIKKGIPGQELSNSRNSKQKSNELKPKPNGGSFKNIGNVENYDYSGITIDNGVIKGLNGRELSNLKNSKKRPNDRNPKSNGEFFSNIGNDDEFSGLNMSEASKANIREIRASNKLK